MNKNYPFADLESKINSSQKIFIFLPPHSTFDRMASALGLGLSLEGLGKKVSLVCPTPITVEFNRLVGVDKIADKAQGSDLIVSLNYRAEQIEKVSYNDDGGKPNIVIQPKTGAPSLTKELVEFSYAGTGGDLAFVIGASDLNALALSSQNFLPQTVVNIDIEETNTNFGQINLTDFQASSYSEVVLGTILSLNLPFNQDIAQNLLSGIWQATDGLTSDDLGPDVYEGVAVCLRKGAQKPSEKISTAQVVAKEEKPPKKPPADWFEPKIFKGSNIA